MAKQRQVRIEQKSALSQMQALETRSDEELERETRMKAPALAILGARAAERYDAKASREYFRRAVAAARPQERMQIRRMADASLALAERRPDDLKAAVERLGQQAPSSRQLFLLRMMGLFAPAQGAPRSAKIRGAALIVGLIVALLLIGFLLVKLIALPFGGAGTGSSVLLGFVLIIAILAVLTLVGRRRQAKALAARVPGGPPPAGGSVKAGKRPAPAAGAGGKGKSAVTGGGAKGAPAAGGAKGKPGRAKPAPAAGRAAKKK